MNDILVVSGWYSDENRWKQYSNRSKLTFDSKWFRDYWIPQIEHFIEPYYYFYISNCEIMPNLSLSDEIADRAQFVFATKPASQLDHRHGFHSAIMNGLQFALTEGFDFLFIEQDCFVHRLDRVIDWCWKNVVNDKWIAYGFGQYSFADGWAEQSLIYVPNSHIALILAILNGSRIHETKGEPMPEVIWHRLFEKYFISFPFGYGRHEVENWDEKMMFYKQQLSDSDIRNFLLLRK